MGRSSWGLGRSSCPFLTRTLTHKSGGGSKRPAWETASWGASTVGLQDGEDCGSGPMCHQEQVWRRGGQRLHLGQLSLRKATRQKTHLLFSLTQLGTHPGNCHSEYSLQSLCVHTHNRHDAHGYLTEAQQAEHLPSVQEALSILNRASQCGDASITSACRSRQEGQELKASPDYMRPRSQNIITGQQDDGSVGTW